MLFFSPQKLSLSLNQILFFLQKAFPFSPQVRLVPLSWAVIMCVVNTCFIICLPADCELPEGKNVY